MPELPEVETVKNALSRLIIGKTIREIDVRTPKIIKNTTSDNFVNQLIGQTFTNVRRRGKYLFLDLDTNTIVSHLRMEGKYNYYDEMVELSRHDHIVFYFTDGSMLSYHDTRQFGTMELVELGQEHTLNSVNKLGYEPFDKELSADYLFNKAQKKHIAVKQFLLDQTIILGLGNIYVDETLFKAKINPKTPVNKISKKQWEKIIDDSKVILNKAISLGGTSVHSFLATGNVSGKFQNELYVYGRGGEECHVCGSEIKKIKLGGRGTHYCPKCQGEYEDSH